MNLWQQRATAIAALLVTLSLAACGGGSSSSGGGSSGSDKSSSIVIQLSSNLAMHQNLLQQSQGVSLIVSALSDLFVRNAVAQTAGVKVYVDGSEVGETDSVGNFAVAVTSGTHSVCIDDPNDSDKCMDVNVGNDQVLVISGVDLDAEGKLVNGMVTTESAFDNIVLFQDPDKEHKTLVCHKGKTISVGTAAALTGHMVHGDSPDECVGAGPATDVGDDTTSDTSPEQTKVTICHKPDGNPKTMTVPESAVGAHVGHGDAIGACGGA